MLRYNRTNKANARQLRTHMTDSERALWARLRRKQILGVQFYRQKPVGNYIVDFYAPAAKLVIEVDGSQHSAAEGRRKDLQRDRYLTAQGLLVLRFDNLQVLQNPEAVTERIISVVRERLEEKNPPQSPFGKGGSRTP